MNLAFIKHDVLAYHIPKTDRPSRHLYRHRNSYQVKGDALSLDQGRLNFLEKYQDLGHFGNEIDLSAANDDTVRHRQTDLPLASSNIRANRLLSYKDLEIPIYEDGTADLSLYDSVPDEHALTVHEGHIPPYLSVPRLDDHAFQKREKHASQTSHVKLAPLPIATATSLYSYLNIIVAFLGSLIWKFPKILAYIASYFLQVPAILPVVLGASSVISLFTQGFVGTFALLLSLSQYIWIFGKFTIKATYRFSILLSNFVTQIIGILC